MPTASLDIATVATRNTGQRWVDLQRRPDFIPHGPVGLIPCSIDCAHDLFMAEGLDHEIHSPQLDRQFNRRLLA
jgi:hypothetical protein